MLLALDTETELIAERGYVLAADGKTRINTTPFETPRLVLVSLYDGQRSWLTDDERAVADALSRATSLALHNAAFDIPVLLRAFPRLRDALLRFIEEGTLIDTMLLEMLLGIGSGWYDMPAYSRVTRSWTVPQLRQPSLASLAKRYLGMELDKDPGVRLTFGSYVGRLGELPARHRQYALDDAVATHGIARAQLERAPVATRWGPLGLALQVQASLAFAALERRGVRIDSALAKDLRARFEGYAWPLRAALVRFGLGRWTPASTPAVHRVAPGEPVQVGGRDVIVAPSPDWVLLDRSGYIVRATAYKHHHQVRVAPADFSLDVRAVQRRLAPVAKEIARRGSRRPPRRADGTLSLDFDYWNEHAPPDEDLQTWLQLGKLTKVLTTYLDVYARADRVFPRWWTLGARSGRTSTAAPNVQNVPKRKLGIRSLFLPSPARILVRADYSAQELVTLAEVLVDMGIDGPLAEAVRAGGDIHTNMAADFLGKAPADVTKEERQGQKVLSFGVPGGLGARRLAEYANKVFGVTWDLEECVRRRAAFLRHFSDIADYLERIGRMRNEADDELVRIWQERGCPEGTTPRVLLRQLLESTNPEERSIGERLDRVFTVRLPTGFERRHARYTEAANTNFQGLAAAVSKRALWLAERAGLHTVLFVHDELVIETAPSEAAADAQRLKDAMLTAFREVCPRLGPYAQVELEYPLTRWGPTTDIAGEILRPELYAEEEDIQTKEEEVA